MHISKKYQGKYSETENDFRNIPVEDSNVNEVEDCKNSEMAESDNSKTESLIEPKELAMVRRMINNAETASEKEDFEKPMEVGRSESETTLGEEEEEFEEEEVEDEQDDEIEEEEWEEEEGNETNDEEEECGEAEDEEEEAVEGEEKDDHDEEENDEDDHEETNEEMEVVSQMSQELADNTYGKDHTNEAKDQQEECEAEEHETEGEPGDDDYDHEEETGVEGDDKDDNEEKEKEMEVVSKSVQEIADGMFGKYNISIISECHSSKDKGIREGDQEEEEEESKVILDNQGFGVTKKYQEREPELENDVGLSGGNTDEEELLIENETSSVRECEVDEDKKTEKLELSVQPKSMGNPKKAQEPQALVLRRSARVRLKKQRKSFGSKKPKRKRDEQKQSNNNLGLSDGGDKRESQELKEADDSSPPRKRPNLGDNDNDEMNQEDFPTEGLLKELHFLNAR